METQQEVCVRLGVAAEPPSAGEKLGIALLTIGAIPINGLRIRVEGRAGGLSGLVGRRRSIPTFISRFMSSTSLNTCHRSSPTCHCRRGTDFRSQMGTRTFGSIQHSYRQHERLQWVDGGRYNRSPTGRKQPPPPRQTSWQPIFAIIRSSNPSPASCQAQRSGTPGPPAPARR